MKLLPLFPIRFLAAWWAAVFAVICGSSTALAVKPTADVMERMRQDGTLDEYAQVTESARRRGLDQPDAVRLSAQAPPVLGVKKALVILVDFTDNVASAGSVTDTAYFSDLLFSTNVPASSLNDFYIENSYGKMSVTGDVIGWLRMPQTYRYYAGPVAGCNRGLGSPPRNAQQLAADAVLAANVAGVDFSEYDNDNDGQMDGFFVVHAGPGFEETGDLCDIHSHKWSLSTPLTLDGVTISNYTMQPEEQGSGAPVNIGVFCHEFGHFFGLPDLYDTDVPPDTASQGLDKWSLMAAGNYARPDGSSPSHFDPWCKIQLGWLTPIQVTSNLLDAPIPQIESDTVVYRLWAGGAGGNQYYLVENRQRTLFDSFLPGGGLLIYRIDDNIGSLAPNNNEWYPGHTSSGHFKIALEQADGLWELEKSPGAGPLVADNGDPWPGSTVNRSFDDLSTPDSRDYNFTTTQVAVWNISNSGPLMTANLDVTWSRPNLQLLDWTFDDTGDADGTPDPGEQADMFVRHRNAWAAASSAELRVSCDDSELVFTDSVASLGTVPTGDTSVNVVPIHFSVPPGKQPRITDFYITVEADGGAYLVTDTIRVDVGPKMILLVDDDGDLGPTASHDSAFILPVLDVRRTPYDRWEVNTSGTPGGLGNYPVVIWYTGNLRDTLFGGSDSLISPSEATALRNYLSAGGRLFITGQQIARYLDSLDRSFLSDFLHASYVGSADDIFAIGVNGDPIGDSTLYVLGGSGGAGNQLAKDRIAPLGTADVVFTESDPGSVTGIRFDSTYRVVFLGWGVEGIGDNVQGFGASPKSVLINRTVDWLLELGTDVEEEGGVVRPHGFQLGHNFPNPFNPSTTIEFVRTGPPAHVRLSVYNLLGQRVRRLVSGSFDAGRHRVVWDGKDDQGRVSGSGVYFYRLESQGYVENRKMLLLK